MTMLSEATPSQIEAARAHRARMVSWGAKPERTIPRQRLSALAEFPLNLRSKIFDKVRVPCRASFYEVAQACADRLGFTRDELRTQYPKRASDEVVEARTVVAQAMLDAGAQVPTIAHWFGYTDTYTVRRWLGLSGHATNRDAP